MDDGNTGLLINILGRRKVQIPHGRWKHVDGSVVAAELKSFDSSMDDGN